jgi:hypothetical protein
MVTVLMLLVILVSLAAVYGRPQGPPTYGPPPGWSLDNFSALVSFGDSYTDESRAWYMNDHGGAGPPAGWIEPVVSPSFMIHNLFMLV